MKKRRKQLFSDKHAMDDATSYENAVQDFIMSKVRVIVS